MEEATKTISDLARRMGEADLISFGLEGDEFGMFTEFPLGIPVSHAWISYWSHVDHLLAAEAEAVVATAPKSDLPQLLQRLRLSPEGAAHSSVGSLTLAGSSGATVLPVFEAGNGTQFAIGRDGDVAVVVTSRGGRIALVGRRIIAIKDPQPFIQNWVSASTSAEL